MKNTLLIATIWIASATGSATAGSIIDGKWSANGCGQNPEAPVLDNRNIDTFNKSVNAISDWQQKSRIYLECLIKEANADNKLIADSANKQQEQYREKLEKLSAQAKSASDALGKK